MILALIMKNKMINNKISLVLLNLLKIGLHSKIQIKHSNNNNNKCNHLMICSNNNNHRMIIIINLAVVIMTTYSAK